MPPGPRWAAADYQRPLGIGAAKAQAAREIVLGTPRRHLELARRDAEGGGRYRLDEDLLLESMHGQAASMAFDAIELLVRMSGSSHAVRAGQRFGECATARCTRVPQPPAGLRRRDDGHPTRRRPPRPPPLGVKVVGYAAELRVRPGESIGFHVSSTEEGYASRIVRLLHGDDDPAGPGFRRRR